METNYSGPFFVKSENSEYVLSDVCKNCAFGDEISCCLNPCIYFQVIAESDEENEKDASDEN